MGTLLPGCWGGEAPALVRAQAEGHLTVNWEFAAERHNFIFNFRNHLL
ncbi:MAG: hypothetical protein RI942_927 [Pseudomonadota bacterium]|jgi:hypothetical protein